LARIKQIRTMKWRKRKINKIKGLIYSS